MPTKNLEEDLFHVKKVLFVSHTANFSKFNRPFMRWFQEQGYTVHYASAGEEQVLDCDRHFVIPFERSPFSLKNVQAYRQLKQVIDRENYKLIHCHTPVGGVVTRLAARQARKRGTKVLYTAHGFHFFKGAPLKNWLLFYPVEKWMARYTDCLIVMNEEDFAPAEHKLFPAGHIEKIDGVGVDLTKFSPVLTEQKNSLRKQYGYAEKDFILIYIAEFIPRKNHAFILSQLPQMKKKIGDLRVIFAGKGDLLEESKQRAKELGVDDICAFLGYRRDVDALLDISDVLISSSRQEGLPINVIEGMACGLPIVCAKIRGQVDVIVDGENGFLYDVDDENGFCRAICDLYEDPSMRTAIGKRNTIDVQKYALDRAVESMADIYRSFLEE